MYNLTEDHCSIPAHSDSLWGLGNVHFRERGIFETLFLKETNFMLNRTQMTKTQEAILGIIAKKSPISRTDVARLLRLTKATVSKNTNRLIQRGLVKEEGCQSSSGGRRPISLRISSGLGYLIGADLGGENLRIGVLHPGGKIIKKLSEKTRLSPDGHLTLAQLKEGISKCIDQLPLPRTELRGIGIGVSAFVDHKRGVCRAAPNITGWENVFLKDFVEEEFQTPTFVDDSARVMALAESWRGVAQDVENFIFVSVGVGIGSGVFIDGRLYRGSRGTASELGHTAVEENGPTCNCGSRGCLETVASGRAIEREAKQALQEGSMSLIRKLTGGDLSKVSAHTVIQAARKGDKLASNIVEKAGVYLGISIANTINLFNPELVVIGAGISRAGNLILEPVKRTVRARALRLAAASTEIKISSLDDDAGVLGAGILALQGTLSMG